ncbi:hypothetical protein [Nocardia sp. BMG51109]|uniref:hypothetical protein n=1 Tax=Nocardia sp. BMG51109 TaxID=1056816 RepID=UPI0004ADAA37|nr:hypothetical protein [Nocardia sp. BMG51109]
MKRSMLTLITAGMLLAGTAVVELLDGPSAGATPPAGNPVPAAASGSEVHAP